MTGQGRRPCRESERAKLPVFDDGHGGREIRLTDARVHHHFGSRDRLLQRPFRLGASRLRANRETMERRRSDPFDIAGLAHLARL